MFCLIGYGSFTFQRGRYIVRGDYRKENDVNFYENFIFRVQRVLSRNSFQLRIFI